MDYKKMDYEKMYEDIMNIDAGIRLVTICDSHGRAVYSEHREGVKNLLTPEESKESLELAVNSWKTRTKLAPKIGKGKYVLAEYEKIKRITMPLGDDDHHLLYITTEVQADHSNIIRRVSEITIRKLLL
jgi:plasmid stability protein